MGYIFLNILLMILIFFYYSYSFYKKKFQLEPEISIQEKKKLEYWVEQLDIQYKKQKTIPSFDINSVGIAMLKKIKGIGNLRAEKIIGWRKELGGFYKIEQIAEISIPSKVLKSLKKYAFVDTNKIKKIAINKITYQKLSQHPYISKKIANRLIKNREIYGFYKGKKDLLKTQPFPSLLDSNLYVKLSPYLSFSIPSASSR